MGVDLIAARTIMGETRALAVESSLLSLFADRVCVRPHRTSEWVHWPEGAESFCAAFMAAMPPCESIHADAALLRRVGGRK